MLLLLALKALANMADFVYQWVGPSYKPFEFFIAVHHVLGLFNGIFFLSILQDMLSTVSVPLGSLEGDVKLILTNVLHNRATTAARAKTSRRVTGVNANQVCLKSRLSICRRNILLL